MVRHIQPLPVELYRNWAALTVAEKTDILEFYKKHGWKLIFAETVDGTTEFAWENVYAAERTAVMKANREAFPSLLTTDQLKGWKQICSIPTVFAVNGVMTEEIRKEGTERRRVFEQFKSTMSEDQRAAHEAITDFTKANWK